MVLGLAIFGAVVAFLTLVVVIGAIIATFATNPSGGGDVLEMN